MGMSARSSGYGTLEWANERKEEVRVEITLSSTGGVFSSPAVEYRNSFRLFPTSHYRTASTNVVKTDTYDVVVEVEPENDSASSGPFTTTWTPAGCYHQTLIIRVTRDLTVEFRQREC
jgi:hypothetical protein